MSFERLSERHLPLVDAFCCIESNERLSAYKSDVRRRIKKHSEEMDIFLKKRRMMNKNAA